MNGRVVDGTTAIAEPGRNQTHGVMELVLRATHIMCALLFLSALAVLLD